MTNQEITMLANAAVESHILMLSDQEVLTEDLKKLTSSQLEKIKRGVSDTMKKLESSVESKGIRVSVVKQKAKKVAAKYAGKIKAHQKRGTAPSVASKDISKELVKDAGNTIKSVVKSYSIMSMPEKILIAILAFLVVLYVNTLIITLVAIISQSPDVAVMVGLVIVAPLVEEAAKKYFAANDMPWVGTGIVFGLELVMDVVKMLMMGIGLGKALLLRAIGLLMHFTTQAIQVKGAEEDWAGTAYTISVLIHATFNFLALAFGKEIMTWAKG
jgi:hypothetical protein